MDASELELLKNTWSELFSMGSNTEYPLTLRKDQDQVDSWRPTESNLPTTRREWIPDLLNNVTLSTIKMLHRRLNFGRSRSKGTLSQPYRLALRALFKTFRARDDLIRNYPEAVRGDLYNLLTWALTWGVTIDRSRSALEPYREGLRELHEQLREADSTLLSKVHEFAAYLGGLFECKYLVDVGCSSPAALTRLSPKFQIVGVCWNSNFELCRSKYKDLGTWIKGNPCTAQVSSLPKRILQRAAVVCSDVNPHASDMNWLTRNLKNWLNHAPICVLSIPQTASVNSRSDGFQSSTSQAVGWNSLLLQQYLQSRGLNVVFTGSTSSGPSSSRKLAAVAVIERNLVNRKDASILKRAGPDFRVVAFVKTYNEEDIIVPTIKYLISQGIKVYLIDNWSTDSTWDKIMQLSSQDVIGVERFPASGPPEYWNYWEYLRHVESLTSQIKADWFINNDADEIRASPWPEISLRNGIYIVDQSGFNCIDYSVIDFPPTDNSYVSDTDLNHFRYFEFSKQPGFSLQRKTWKNFGQSVDLTSYAGHDIQFKGRRIYPYKFLLKHYPIRSQHHGEKKIFRERRPRYHPLMKRIGWAVQYDHIKNGHVFLRKPSELEYYDESTFNDSYLIERLSSIGVFDYLCQPPSTEPSTTP